MTFTDSIDEHTGLATDSLPQDEADFWAMAERCFSTATHYANERLAQLEHVELADVRRAIGPYRFFTGQYTADLAILIAKLPPGDLRSSLGTFLDDELGSGDPYAAHPQMYDRFLISIGCDPDHLDELATPVSHAILHDATERLWSESVPYGIGLRAMGAECLCGAYLTAAQHYIRRNPAVRAIEDSIDWEFLVEHSHGVDFEHREQTRQRIADIVQNDPGSIQEMARGYRHAETQWHKYWDSSLPAA